MCIFYKRFNERKDLLEVPLYVYLFNTATLRKKENKNSCLKMSVNNLGRTQKNMGMSKKNYPS